MCTSELSCVCVTASQKICSYSERSAEATVIMICWITANSFRQTLQLCDLLCFHSHFVHNPRMLRTNFVHFHADTDWTRACEDEESSETCPETLATDVVRMFVTIQTGHQYNLRTVTAVTFTRESSDTRIRPVSRETDVPVIVNDGLSHTSNEEEISGVTDDCEDVPPGIHI